MKFNSTDKLLHVFDFSMRRADYIMQQLCASVHLTNIRLNKKRTIPLLNLWTHSRFHTKLITSCSLFNDARGTVCLHSIAFRACGSTTNRVFVTNNSHRPVDCDTWTIRGCKIPVYSASYWYSLQRRRQFLNAERLNFSQLCTEVPMVTDIPLNEIFRTRILFRLSASGQRPLGLV